MYNNIASKLKGLAWFGFIIGSIVYIISGVVILIGSGSVSGVIIIVLGPIASWITSWALYGLGHLIDIAEEINQHTQLLVNRSFVQSNIKNDYPVREESKKEDKIEVVTEVQEENKQEKNTPDKQQPKVELTLSEKLSFALQYTTDDGMIMYLKTIDDERVKSILNAPKKQIRDLVSDLIKEL